MAELLTRLDLDIVRRLADASDAAGRPGPGADGDEGSGAGWDPALVRLLITDSLTGVYNRAYFQERLQRELAAASAHSPLALVLVDLDRFKELNDAHGHAVGDQALRELASALRAAVPDRAVPCRIGGDEFALLVPRVTAAEVEWIRVALAHAITQRQIGQGFGRLPVRLSASLGLAVAPADGLEPQELLTRADADMYTSKRRTRGESSPGPRVARGRPPLVGRDGLLDKALALLTAAGNGNGNLLFLSGPPGIGKSRLGQEVAERAAAAGFVVVQSVLGTGEGDEGPMAAVRRCAAALVAAVGPRRARSLARRAAAADAVVALAQGSRRAGGAGQEPELGQVAEGIRLLLADAATRRPLFWMVDDVRLADTSTLAVLEHLAGSLAELRAMVVAVARTEGAWAAQRQLVDTWWQRLDHLACCQRREVPALAGAAAAELARWALGSAIALAQLAELPAVAGGNPLHILRLGARQPVLPGQGATPSGEEDRLPLDLPGLYAAELARLPAAHRALLAAAAVLGYEVAPATLSLVAPETPDRAQRTLDTLVAAGWLEWSGERLRFTHPLARETAYSQIPPALQRSLHRLCARILSAFPGHAPADLARHCEAGGDWSEAVSYHRAAGGVAEAVYAYGESARHYRRCLQLAEVIGQLPADAGQLATRAAHLFRLDLDTTAQEDMLQFSLSHQPTARDRGGAMVKLAHVYMDSGRPELFYALNEQAVQLLRPLGPSPELAEALMRQVRVEHRLKHRAGAAQVACEDVAVARALGDADAAVRWAAGAGYYVSEASQFTVAADCLAVARAEVRAAGGLRAIRSPLALLTLGFALRRLGYLQPAVHAQRAAQLAAQRQGDTHTAFIALQEEVVSLLALVEVDLARRALGKAKPLFRRSNRKGELMTWLEKRFRCCLYAHDLAAAANLAELLVRQGSDIDAGLYAPALVAQAQMAGGQQPDPTRWMPAHLLPVPYTTSSTAPYLLVGAQVQLLAGAAGAAQVLVDAAREHLVDYYEFAWIEWMQGSILAATGQPAAAVRAFRRALRPRGHRYYHALSHRDLVRLYLHEHRAGRQVGGLDRATASKHLHRASQLFSRMGNDFELVRLGEMEQRWPALSG